MYIKIHNNHSESNSTNSHVPNFFFTLFRHTEEGIHASDSAMVYCADLRMYGWIWSITRPSINMYAL